MSATLTTLDRKPWFRFLSGILAHIMLIAAIVLPLQAALIWLLWTDGVNFTLNGDPFYGSGVTPSINLRMSGLTIFLAAALVQAWGLLGLRRTFQDTSKGRVFSKRSVQGFRRFAYTSLIIVFATAFNDGVFEGIKAASALEAQAGSFSFTASFPDLTDVLLALLLLFVAQAFVIGEQMQDETDGFL